MIRAGHRTQAGRKGPSAAAARRPPAAWPASAGPARRQGQAQQGQPGTRQRPPTRPRSTAWPRGTAAPDACARRAATSIEWPRIADGSVLPIGAAARVRAARLAIAVQPQLPRPAAASAQAAPRAAATEIIASRARRKSAAAHVRRIECACLRPRRSPKKKTARGAARPRRRPCRKSRARAQQNAARQRMHHSALVNSSGTSPSLKRADGCFSRFAQNRTVVCLSAVDSRNRDH